MRAYVLHLERATARRANAERLLETCGVSGKLWPATNGADLSQKDLATSTGAHLFDPYYPFPLRTGEVGCFLSHRKIWAEIIESDLDCAIIFEDDVKLDEVAFKTALELAQRNVNALGYIQLQNRPPSGNGRLVDQVDEFTLSIPTITPLRASAQMISKDAAKLLFHKSKRFDRPVDTFVQSHWHTGLRPGVIYPAGVNTIAAELDGSTIQGGHKPLGTRLKRELSRAIYRRRVRHHSYQSSAPLMQNEV